MNVLKFMSILIFSMSYFQACGGEDPEPKIKISFESNGGNSVNSVKIDYDNMNIFPENPVKTGFMFSGWYLDDQTFQEPLDFDYLYENQMTSDLTVYARWEIVDPLQTMFFNSSTNFGITESGKVVGWGRNQYGQIGDGTLLDRPFFTDISAAFPDISIDPIIQFYSGSGHVIAISQSGQVFSWGNNYYGQLGDGTYDNKTIPVNITSYLDLYYGETIEMIAISYASNFALTSSNRVLFWGQVVEDINVPGYGERNHTPQDITTWVKYLLNTGEEIVKIEVNESNCYLQTSENRVFVWGSNEFQSIIDDPTQNIIYAPYDFTGFYSFNAGEYIVDLYATSLTTLVKTSENRIFSFGANFDGMLGFSTQDSVVRVPVDITPNFNLATDETILTIETGGSMLLALSSKGRVFSWGWNGSGSLGDGTTTTRETPYDITSRFSLLTGETIISIYLSNNCSHVLTSEGRLFAFGNNNGKYGDGTTIPRNKPTLIY